MVVTEGSSESFPDYAAFTRILSYTMLVVASFVTYTTVQAGEWKLNTKLKSSLSYVDNIYVDDPDNTDSSRIFEITPHFNLSGMGRYVKANFDYQMQNLFYSNNPIENESDNKQFHRLSAIIKTELAERILFFDASATVDQQNKSTLGSGALDNISLSEERGTTTKMSVSPYVYHVGNGGFITDLRYRADKLSSEEGIANEVDTQTMSLFLNSGQLAKRWQWSLSSQVRDLNYVSETDQQHISTELGLSYRLFPKTTLSLNSGTERIEYEVDNIESTGGDFWRLKAEWQPGKWTAFIVGVGERYFGTSYNFSMEHKTRRAKFNISYNEDITNRSLIQFEQENFTLEGDPLSSIEGVDQYQVLTTPVLSSETILIKRWNGGVFWQLAKTKLALKVGQSESIYQTTDGSERLNSAEANWKWDVYRRWSLGLTEYYRYRRIDLQGSSEQLFRSEMKISRDLWSGASCVFSIVDDSKNVSDDSKDYEQQRVSLAFNAKW